jgi:hypothetical protein
MATPATLSRAEKRRQQSLERKELTAAEVVRGSVPEARSLSFTGNILQQAMPMKLQETGRVAFESTGQPRVAFYDPTLLAPNPQRGRLLDRGLDELAKSLSAHGQQEAIIARLITDMDRKRWPEAFTEEQLLVILSGHRIFFAQPKSSLSKLKVELLLPLSGENDATYIRRSLQRASIKIMHSQAYTILDKVHQYLIWRDEYQLGEPKDGEVAAYFEVSRTEAQRLKVVSTLDEKVAQDILNSEKRPADEIIYLIANRPPEQQREAFKEFGSLTVTAARTLAKEEKSQKLEGAIQGSGRPRNYSVSVRIDGSPIIAISTSLSAQQWKKKGGARAFWECLRKISHSKELQERLKDDLD